ncbi:MAG: NAD(P)H-dependent oxidoreductase [Shinella sp.]|nr:NAD(P)H-dependent oxidoreductase [Shinella sp.]
MSKTLILLFHPDLRRSKANAALAAAAAKLSDVEIADMYALYPDGRIDADAEVRRLLSADRVVFQFPVQWYSTPPLMKAWQDMVLTRMMYIAYEAEGRKLEGTPLMVAATAGNVPEAYRPGGVNLFSMEELLRPLEATANRCGMPWQPALLLYRADRLDQTSLAIAGRDYARILDAWRRETEAQHGQSTDRSHLIEAWG